MGRWYWWVVSVAVGCAGTKGTEDGSDQNTLSGSYVVTGGGDAQGNLGEDEGGSGWNTWHAGSNLERVHAQQQDVLADRPPVGQSGTMVPL